MKADVSDLTPMVGSLDYLVRIKYSDLDDKDREALASSLEKGSIYLCLSLSRMKDLVREAEFLEAGAKR